MNFVIWYVINLLHYYKYEIMSCQFNLFEKKIKFKKIKFKNVKIKNYFIIFIL